MVRDYEVHSKKVNDVEVADLFKKFAEECGYQAAELQKILNNKTNNPQNPINGKTGYDGLANMK
jgi:rubrerythrin